MITTALHIAIPQGVQLGAIDARLEAWKEEVVIHHVDHVCVVHLHVAPEGVAGRHAALDVCVYLPACQRRADVLGGVVDDPSEEAVLVRGRRQGRHGDGLS